MMPTPQLWNVLFFLVLVTMGIGSQYVSIEAVVSAIIDEYPVVSIGGRLSIDFLSPPRKYMFYNYILMRNVSELQAQIINADIIDLFKLI